MNAIEELLMEARICFGKTYGCLGDADRQELAVAVLRALEGLRDEGEAPLKHEAEQEHYGDMWEALAYALVHKLIPDEL